MKRLVVCVGVLLSPLVLADPKCPEIAREEVRVNGQNDEWTATGITVEKGDVLLIEAAGKVKVGNWIGEVTADGDPAGLGRMTYKIGDGGASPAGARAFITVETAGAVKVRVGDKKYEDNSGAFTVTVTRIPAAALPAAKVAADTK